MNTEEVRDLMRHLAGGVGQQRISLQCDCDNLETVYVTVDEGGTVRVTDDHRTFQYLNKGTDDTYVPVESLDWAVAAHNCRELRVELRPAPPDGYPSIECVCKPGELVSEVVERVAQAVDCLFALARRPDLK